MHIRQPGELSMIVDACRTESSGAQKKSNRAREGREGGRKGGSE